MGSGQGVLGHFGNIEFIKASMRKSEPGVLPESREV